MTRPWHLAAILLGVLFIIVGGGYALHGTPVAFAADPARPADSTAELVRASVRGCVEGLGLVEVGVSDQVAIVRCRPNLGVRP